MRRFVTGVSENLEECPEAISYDNMDFSRLIVHEHYVEETNRWKSGSKTQKCRRSD